MGVSRANGFASRTRQDWSNLSAERGVQSQSAFCVAPCHPSTTQAATTLLKLCTMHGGRVCVHHMRTNGQPPARRKRD